MSRSFAAPDVSVRRFLSEEDEKKALRVLNEQLRHQERITSDDVRQAVRSVASQGGAVLLPPDFPPSCWVLEFKRVHGFVHYSDLSFGAMSSTCSNSGGKPASVFGLLERLEVPPLCSATPLVHNQRACNTPTDNTSSICTISTINGKSNSKSRATTAQTTSLSSGNNSDDEKGSSKNRRDLASSAPAHMARYSTSPSGPRTPFDGENQRQVHLRHSFSQRHRQYLQQQQRRANLVDDRRRSAAWSIPMRDSSADQQEIRSNASKKSENGTSTCRSNSVKGGNGETRSVLSSGIRSMLHHVPYVSSNNGCSVEDTESIASSSNDKRGYKLSHTVPAETWDKAIAAVEQQGMSLRAAAKLYGVHFAALHRRVKKRAQCEQTKGTNGYFHPSDEAGIMRVVVARAELGVLMTFDELMRLVEAAALRKLPDISIDSARKLLTRFQTRNEQSIRHIIEDWPSPRPAIDAASGDQHQPFLRHPGFDLRPTCTGGAATAAAVAAATPKSLFVPPIRLVPSTINSRYEPKSPGVRLTDTMRAMELETTKTTI